MNPKYKGWLIAGGVVLIIGIWVISIINKEVRLNQDVKEAWGNVESNYKRRADLVKSVAKIVKAAADFEEQTLIEIVEKRADAAKSIKVDADNLTEEDFKKLQAANEQMSSDFSRLMLIVENYPQLQSVANFRDFQTQMEGSENRINTWRIRYNEAVKKYNSYILRVMPKLILSGKEEKEFFEAEEGLEEVPEFEL